MVGYFLLKPGTLDLRDGVRNPLNLNLRSDKVSMKYSSNL